MKPFVLSRAAARWVALLALAGLAALPSAPARAQQAAAPADAASAPATAATPAAVAPTPAPASAASAPSAPAPSADSARVQVTEPFIELRTGPGRGYPVFFVAEKGAWITIELRRTDWYRVHADGPQGGATGWVQRSQLASTLTEAGAQTTFRDVMVDDYLARRLELGAAWGRFEDEPMLKLWGSYRLAETLALEGTIGQVQGAFSGTDYWHLALVSEPWSDRRWSPYFTVGLGRFTNAPNSSLVGAQVTDTNLGMVGLGLRWYIAERFVARLDWSLLTAFVSDQRSAEYRTLTLGLSFFF